MMGCLVGKGTPLICSGDIACGATRLSPHSSSASVSFKELLPIQYPKTPYWMNARLLEIGMHTWVSIR